jgi:hypothetical protein
VDTVDSAVEGAGATNGNNGGAPGSFGGYGDNGGAGGSGGALGGAIFNDSGNVTVQNSTFSNNHVSHGLRGPEGLGGSATDGGDSGAAIFSRNGSLIVQNVTISGNHASVAGGGIEVYEDGSTTTFILDNTIIANLDNTII